MLKFLHPVLYISNVFIVGCFYSALVCINFCKLYVCVFVSVCVCVCVFLLFQVLRIIVFAVDIVEWMNLLWMEYES